MRLALLHAFVWLGALWATSPDGDCTKSYEWEEIEVSR